MKINVTHIAKLANLLLKNDEIPIFEKQLSSVLDYIQKLNEVDTKNVKETSQVKGLENVLREDKALESLTQEEAISDARQSHNGLFVVKAILDTD